MRVLYEKMGYRCQAFIKVKQKEITLKEASKELRISYRHTRRLYKKYKLGGPMALLPKKRGTPYNATPGEVKERVVSLKADRYQDFNISHFTEMMEKEERIKLSRETVRKILITSGLHKKGKHYPKHRKRFEAPGPGKLVQMDTSTHEWIPGIGKKIKLILMIDDYSRKPLGARFVESDTTWENMLLLREVVEKYGVFDALYTDNDSKFKYTRVNYSRYFDYRKEPEEIETQIDIALGKLGIRLTHSKPYEPEGKGKLERMFGYLQDRLVNEIKLNGIKDLASANKFLKEWIERDSMTRVHAITKQIPDERFGEAHFKPIGPDTNLDDIFCITAVRKVRKDSSFSYNGRDFVLTPRISGAPWIKQEVELHVVPGKKIRVFYRGDFIEEFVCNGN